MTEATPEQKKPRRSWLRPTVITAQIGGAGVGIAGLVGFGSDIPVVLTVLMLTLGVIVVGLAARALRHERISWAFLCSIYGTLSVAFLFGGPKIDEWLQRGAVIAYLPSIACVAITILLILCRDEF